MRKHNRAAALSRSIIADGWRGKVRDRLKAVFAKQARAAERLAAEGGHGFGQFREDWEADLFHSQRPMTAQMAADGYRLAEAEFGKAAALIELCVKSKDILDDFEGVEELIAKRLLPRVDSYLTQTSRLETQTSISLYNDTWKAAVGQNMTAREIADQLLDTGIAWSEVRADLMSRTLTIWSYNAGARQSYADAGIEEMEWLVTEDDLTCEECQAMNGRKVKVDGIFKARNGQPFDIANPPLHPNCRCTILPIVGD